MSLFVDGWHNQILTILALNNFSAMSRQFKLSRDQHPINDEPQVIYVSKKHGVIYGKSGSGKGVDFQHPLHVDLSKYKQVDDNILYRIYELKD